jgi:two-component system LytT family response regulator
LIFLDVEMPGAPGMEFLPFILATTHVVFATAYAEYAAKAFDLGVLDECR